MIAGCPPEIVSSGFLDLDLDFLVSGDGMEAGCQISDVAGSVVRLQIIRFPHETLAAWELISV
jgi:hypothetical protein